MLRLFLSPLLLFNLFLAQLGPTAQAESPPPKLMLAKVYHDGINLTDYWVSEKLDGVRAYWDGQQLLSRRGNRFHAPQWFVRDFPPVPLDGELWMGRGTFDELSGTVRQKVPDDQRWRRVQFMVFDLPATPGDFDQRLKLLKELITSLDSPYIAMVKQYKLADQASLFKRLNQVVEQGGEGLMLHRGAARYTASRTDDLLKLKQYQDAEALVVAHIPGQGKYEGQMGSLQVQTPNGLIFRIGTGFSDHQRRFPPAVGSLVTYRHLGKTARGIPRFAAFVREREVF
ncbi:DNA ligase [Pseudomaricurvus alkylphenolicus]|uniref:DNA ligase n=1 Tax=Pseudomaricurvus alkylphenolicus TaxID=1306991 RepID=UPI001980B63F|nr:DNA ligase [Pseudomaricurvus alkylphenolicus]